MYSVLEDGILNRGLVITGEALYRTELLMFRQCFQEENQERNVGVGWQMNL